MVVSRAWSGKIGEAAFSGPRASVWEDEKTFGDRLWSCLYSRVSVLNATEPNTLKR